MHLISIPPVLFPFFICYFRYTKSKMGMILVAIEQKVNLIIVLIPWNGFGREEPMFNMGLDTFLDILGPELTRIPFKFCVWKYVFVEIKICILVQLWCEPYSQASGLSYTVLCRLMRWLVSLSKLCTAQLRPHPYWVSKHIVIGRRLIILLSGNF